MFLNDSLGDCVIAAMAHMIMQWSYYASGGSGMYTPTDQQVLAAYEILGGYQPGNPDKPQPVPHELPNVNTVEPSSAVQ